MRMSHHNGHRYYMTRLGNSIGYLSCFRWLQLFPPFPKLLATTFLNILLILPIPQRFPLITPFPSTSSSPSISSSASLPTFLTAGILFENLGSRDTKKPSR